MRASRILPETKEEIAEHGQSVEFMLDHRLTVSRIAFCLLHPKIGGGMRKSLDDCASDSARVKALGAYANSAIYDWYKPNAIDLRKMSFHPLIAVFRDGRMWTCPDKRDCGEADVTFIRTLISDERTNLEEPRPTRWTKTVNLANKAALVSMLTPPGLYGESLVQRRIVKLVREGHPLLTHSDVQSFVRREFPQAFLEAAAIDALAAQIVGEGQFDDLAAKELMRRAKLEDIGHDYWRRPPPRSVVDLQLRIQYDRYTQAMVESSVPPFCRPSSEPDPLNYLYGTDILRGYEGNADTLLVGRIVVR